MPRTGTMIRASGGNGGEGAEPRVSSEPVVAQPFGASDFSSVMSREPFESDR